MARARRRLTPTLRPKGGAVLLEQGSVRNRGKPRCCPKMPARKVPRSIHEKARDVARDIAKTDAYVRSRRERKKIEMLFAHLKRILRLDRLRLRGPSGARTNSSWLLPPRTSESWQS